MKKTNLTIPALLISLCALFATLSHADPAKETAKKSDVFDETACDRIAAAMPLPRISPRPVKVPGVAAPTLSLNGTWKFSPEGSATAHSKNIEVPGEWAMQGFAVAEGVFAEYYHTFDVPADWRGKVARLRFDAVHAVCKVFVNDKEIGGHEGGFVPFELDATDAIRAGATNEIRVQVQSESLADHIAFMSHYSAHQVGGIIRKVTLFALPRVNIATQTWTVAFDENYKDATLAIDTVIDAPDARQSASATLRHELFSPDGKRVATATGDKSSSVIAVSAPLHWTSETPALYTLKTTLLAKGKPVETITQRVGFRQVEIRGNVYHINGKPVKLFGVCRHEIHPLTGRAITPALCREDALLFRESNCNFIRTSHYPPSEEFLDACDELGIFVECEAAVVWVKDDGGAGYVWRTRNLLAPEVFGLLLRANLDNIAANRAHPCVIQWSIANESRWSPLFDKVNKIMKSVDPTRPTIFHDQHWGEKNNAGSTADVANHHYPNEKNPDTWSASTRPIIFGEFAHVQCYNRRELETDPFIREDWGRATAHMVDLMWAQRGIAGGTIWSGVDEAFHMPDGALRGYGHWGLIDMWRRKKPEWFGGKKAFTPVKIFNAAEPHAVTGGMLTLQVQNRFNFTNLKDVKITWQAGASKGVVTADIEPHAKGEIKIPVPNAATDAVEIAVTDLHGLECARERITITPKKPPSRAAQKSSKPATLTDDAGHFTITSADDSKTFRFDKTTGNLTLALGDAAVIKNEPVALMVLPLDGSGSVRGPTGARFITNKIAPRTSVCADWKPASVEAVARDGKVTVSIRGDYKEASGETLCVIDGDGVMEVRYTGVMKEKINPRQWGMVFTLPRAFDTLAWESLGTWTTAPADSIGRPRGTAKANPVAREDIEEVGKSLRGIPWPSDANALGTNDFRSTKAHIHRASLGNGGVTFVVEPCENGDASTRAWVEGNNVKLLVAGFNTGGYDSFFNVHYAKERRPLAPGDKIEGRFTVRVGR